MDTDPSDAVECAMQYRLDTQRDPPTLYLSGRMEAGAIGPMWRPVLKSMAELPPGALAIDASEVEYCDGVGIGLLAAIRRAHTLRGGETELVGLDARFEPLLKMDTESAEAIYAQGARAQPASFPEQVGRGAVQTAQDIASLVAFIGEATAVSVAQLFRPRRIRWREFWMIVERTGADALPLIVLLGFLIGFITAFQSALPMKQFGVEIFVADLLGLSVLRELGPLITGIILAGRSGSAFAAELSAMKVGEEIDAYRTMGIDPIRFLVVPRIFAALFVTPLLTIFFMLFSLIGGGVVMLSLGFPPVAYLNQLFGAISHIDLISGLFKAFVFGLLIAGIGCQRGLAAGRDAGAVGTAATRAVVGGILLIIVSDGVFAALFYALGI